VAVGQEIVLEAASEYTLLYRANWQVSPLVSPSCLPAYSPHLSLQIDTWSPTFENVCQVEMIRKTFPGVVFVTASELAQLKASGVP